MNVFTHTHTSQTSEWPVFGILAEVVSCHAKVLEHYKRLGGIYYTPFVCVIQGHCEGGKDD